MDGDSQALLQQFENSWLRLRIQDSHHRGISAAFRLVGVESVLSSTDHRCDQRRCI